ncbi:cytochrome P450 [Fistulina hepatica ATCC 64428]|uniref:Cytochrome P450 n=1 Tax=Fistulina hepatica ATCC 64428 TaxID=1128425 RepID=A0A0D7AI57_9AGAR|nr:cytochrome P450 [Fistulina hepatica ATCC 64428]
MVFSLQDYTALGATALVLIVIRYVRYLRKDVNKLPLAPASDSHWLWGHEYRIWQSQANVMYTKWAAAVGPVYRIKAALFQSDVIVASDNASSSHVLRHAQKYAKAPAFLPVTIKLIGRGVVWAHGEEHKRQRRMITPAFTIAAVRGMEDAIVESTERLVNVAGGAKGETTVNIEPQVASCTLDIVGRVAFGHDFCAGESSDAQAISSAWHQDVMLGRTFTGFLAPVLIGAFPWLNHLPIPALQQDGVAKTIALRIASDMLKENRAALAANNNARDILSILVRDMQSRADSKEEPMEDWRLLENISTFIMVGHETTSCSVIFTLLELARNQEIQAKLRKELQAASDVTYNTLSKLEYLDAVTKEGLRLHPASPRTDRIATEDDVLPQSKPIVTRLGESISSIHIKKGQIVQIPSSVLNTNPEVWGPDAHDFKPERWIAPGALPPADQLPQGPYANLATFIDGPRVAVMEFKMIIAYLVHDIIFEATGAEVEEYISGTLQAFCDGKGANMPMKVRLA